MSKTGTMLRAMTRDGYVRALVADTTEIVKQAIDIHHTMPTASAALGRVLTAASLMGSLLKDTDNSLTLSFKGDGIAGGILAVSDYAGNVRGYITNPAADLPLNSKGKLDVAGIVGKGVLLVLRELGTGEPYIGQTPIVSGEIAEDIASYFVNSEQLPTVCGLGVLVGRDYSCDAAGGLLVQLLPGYDESVVSRLEQSARDLPQITSMLSQGMSLTDILDKALGGMEYDVFDELDIEYRCTCSRERMEKALISLGKEELSSMIEEDGGAEISCHFCNKSYSFDGEQLRGMMR
ncbi:MAG: Hsp33 family molecular chaperone HslO [Eubacteriales bacterium]